MIRRIKNTPRPPVSRKGLCLSGVSGAPLAEPSIRYDLVARVRREIEAGTYETEEKLQAALSRLLER